MRGIRDNFRTMYNNNTLCPICEHCIDTQQHVITCKVLLDILPLNKHIDYEHIHGRLSDQIEFVQVYEQYLMLRDELLSDSDDQQASLPGLYTGPVRPQAGARRAAEDTAYNIVNSDGILK